MMNGRGKSDSSVVPEKSPNNAGQPAAEGMEGRGLAKGNPPEQQRVPDTEPERRVQVRWSGYVKQQERIGSCGSRRSCTTSTTSTRLRAAYFALKRKPPPGVDGETWRHYGEATGEESPGPFRTAEARSVPSEAGA